MIVYEPNKNWFRDVGHLFKSWTMKKVIRSVVVMGVYTTGVCLLLHFNTWLAKYCSMDIAVFSFLGVVLSILLVFRTNSAYDRWWEGRKQWGALVNNTRNLALMVNSSFPKDDHRTRKRVAILISNFCIAMKEHLRDGVKTEELISVSKEELAVYNGKNHVPNHIANEIYQEVRDGHQREAIDGYDFINIKPQVTALLDILGACERIRKTPIPFSYAVYIKIFISIYAILLPFGLYDMLSWGAIPINMFIFFAFIGLEMMAAEIEGPFGLDCNDLPTGVIAHTIKENVFEILVEDARHRAEPARELYTKLH